jgi:hypothetical protein
MSAAKDRKATAKHLAALVRTIDPFAMCWGPSPNSAHAWCGGVLVWSKASGEWRSTCPRCKASGLAAASERNALDAAAVRSAWQISKPSKHRT